MKSESIAINTGCIKLDSLLKFAGLTETGGNAKAVIAEGRIIVNGEICTQRGRKIYPGDRIEVPELELVLEITGSGGRETQA